MKKLNTLRKGKFAELFFCFIVLAMVNTGVNAKNFPVHLSVNQMNNPVGLDAENVKNLRFGWQVSSGIQTAYQIQLSNGWDSGKTASSAQNGIRYTGSDLKPKTKYQWKLKIWVDGKESDWVEASFETGILKSEDWTGEWVHKESPKKGSEGELLNSQFNIIRQDFDLPTGKKIERARAFIGAYHYGRGLFGFRINSERPDEPVLMDGMEERYYTLDITKFLHSGKNTFGVMFGDTGIARPNVNKELYGKSSYSITENQFIADIDVWFTDGTHITVGTNNSALGTKNGPVIQADEFDGEHYDAQKEINWSDPSFDVSGWETCNINDRRGKPKYILSSWVKTVEILKPVAISNPKPGVYVFDVGSQISGFQMLNVKGEAGTRIQFRFSELLDDEGMIDRSTILNGLPALQIDSYVLSGKGNEYWQPEFTWHGFRYMEVTGFPGVPTEKNISFRRIAADIVNERASFNCSNPDLNRIHKAFYDTELGNAVFDQTDCNQRGERAPWAADAYCVSEAAMSTFDMPYFWQEKWLNVICRRVGPHGESNAILYGPGDGYRLLWGSHAVRIPWDFYEAYGDKAYLEKTYVRAKQFTDCIINWYDKLDVVTCEKNSSNPGAILDHTSNEDWLIDAETKWKLQDGSDAQNGFKEHGDWVRPDGKWWENVSFINSATYFYCAKLTSLMAAELNKNKDASYYSDVAENIRKAINAKWLVEKDGQVYYCDNHQTPNAMAIHYGIVPDDKVDEVLKSITNNISEQGMHLSTGAIGTLSLMPALSRNGQNEVILKLAQQTTEPSWMGMLDRGPGTLWEQWTTQKPNKAASKSHPFLGGSITCWLHQDVAGIKPAKPGYEEVEISPQIIGDLKYCEASVPTIRGRISSNWKLVGNSFELDVTIPGNTTAKVYLPDGSGVKTIGPGEHHFKSAFNRK